MRYSYTLARTQTFLRAGDVSLKNPIFGAEDHPEASNGFSNRTIGILDFELRHWFLV